MSYSNERANKNIYITLPDSIKEKVFWVIDSYRTNPLSYIEGGNKIIIEYHDEKIFDEPHYFVTYFKYSPISLTESFLTKPVISISF